jgi:hypothetical protein
MVRDGSINVREQFLEESNRRICLRGDEKIASGGVAAVRASQN